MNQKEQSVKLMKFIPVFTTEAGSCLTLANWQEIEVDSLSYSLDALLMKPGLPFLENLNDLRSYVGWQGTLVLNASLAAENSEGVYSLRSRYDGSLLQIGSESLFSLFLSLQPDKLILPADLLSYSNFDWQALLQTTELFIPASDFSESAAKLGFAKYFHYDKTNSFSEFIQAIKQNKGTAIYVAGEFESEQLSKLVEAGVLYLESDKPARDAMIGRIYSKEPIALLDSEMAHHYERIDNHCACPTCHQQLTCAYLHHLLEQTPLLAQRFLIQHNVHFYQNRLTSFCKHYEIAH